MGRLKMKMPTAIVLAAGLGTRMKSSLAKVLHPLCGAPLINWTIKAVKEAGVKKFVIVVGYQKDEVEKAISKSFPRLKPIFVHQTKQLGTAHAVLVTENAFKDRDDDVLIICGDVPLVTPKSLKGFIKFHANKKADLSIITGNLDVPLGYGRILRDENGRAQKIVEETEATDEIKKLKEVNLGVYLISSKLLFKYLKKIKRNNKKGEFFITDLVELLAKDKKRVEAFVSDEPFEFLGINTRWQLACAQKLLQQKVLEKFAQEGVTFIDPERAYVEPTAKIANDVVIWPDVVIKGKTKIAKDCEIGQGSIIIDSVLDEGVKIFPYSVIEGSHIERGAKVGPFARIRPKSLLKEKADIGNFVEIKNSTIGVCTKARHLSYLGDSIIGDRVNIGAGTITCNYDGFSKYQTIIEDEAFIGSDTQFVAPVKIGKGAYIGSGSTITKDVPSDALAVTRAEQKIFEGWARRKREQAKGKKQG